MTQKRIKEVSDFFYSSDDSDKVPIRIAATTGQFGGFDFPKDGLIRLLTIIDKSKNLRRDLLTFRNDYGN